MWILVEGDAIVAFCTFEDLQLLMVMLFSRKILPWESRED